MEQPGSSERIDEPTERGLRRILPYAVVFLLACAVFGQSVTFSIDRFDEDVILGNNLEYLRKHATVVDVVQRDAFFDLPARSFYRPVQNLTFLIDARLGSGKPWVFHATNLLLHVVASCLVLRLLRIWRIRRDVATGMALLFAVHPLLTQAVVWTPGRGDLLLTVFSLLSMLSMRRYMISGHGLWLCVTGLSALLAMLSKETGIVLVLLAPASWVLLHGRSQAPNARLVASSLIVLLCCVLLVLARGMLITDASTSSSLSAANLLTSWPVLPEMLAKFFQPWLLQPLAGYTPLATASGIILLAGCTWLTIGVLRGETTRQALFSLIWYAAFTLPGMMFMHPSGSAAYDYLEHRGYAPSVGIILVLGLLLQRVPRGTTMIAIGGMIIAYGAASVQHARDFSNARTFIHTAVESNPSSAMARTIRGQFRAIDGNVQGAVSDLETVVKAHPDFSLGRAALGKLYLTMKRAAPAIAQLRAAMALDPTLLDMALLLGKAYRMIDRPDSAAIWYGYVNERDTQNFDALVNLGIIESQLGNWLQARTYLARATELAPFSSVAWYNLAITHHRLGSPVDACQCWQRALDLGYEEAQLALNLHCSAALQQQ